MITRAFLRMSRLVRKIASSGIAVVPGGSDDKAGPRVFSV